MIKGKSDEKYWQSLIGAPRDREDRLRTTCDQLRTDMQQDLVEKYEKRLKVAKGHNDILRSLGYLVEKRSDLALGAGYAIAGRLIYEGWQPPAELILTDEGRKVLKEKSGNSTTSRSDI